MIKSIVREHHWSPEMISSLFHDGIDYFGLEYWYNDVKEVVQEMKKK
jgi:hypothetical protein